MQIHQLNIGHVDRQDRLLLRLNTQSAQEFRFWLTRRLTLRLLPILEDALSRLESMPLASMPTPQAQQMLNDIQHEAFLQAADFSTPFADQPAELPLGDEPMLVTDVALQLQDSELRMSLQDKGAPAGQVQSCELVLQTALVHGMAHLVRQAASGAQWLTSHENDPLSEGQKEMALSGYRH